MNEESRRREKGGEVLTKRVADMEFLGRSPFGIIDGDESGPTGRVAYLVDGSSYRQCKKRHCGDPEERGRHLHRTHGGEGEREREREILER